MHEISFGLVIPHHLHFRGTEEGERKKESKDYFKCYQLSLSPPPSLSLVSCCILVCVSFFATVMLINYMLVNLEICRFGYLALLFDRILPSVQSILTFDLIKV